MSLFNGLSPDEFREAIDIQNRLEFYWQGGKPMIAYHCSKCGQDCFSAGKVIVCPFCKEPYKEKDVKEANDE